MQSWTFRERYDNGKWKITLDFSHFPPCPMMLLLLSELMLLAKWKFHSKRHFPPQFPISAVTALNSQVRPREALKLHFEGMANTEQTGNGDVKNVLRFFASHLPPRLHHSFFSRSRNLSKSIFMNSAIVVVVVSGKIKIFISTHFHAVIKLSVGSDFQHRRLVAKRQRLTFHHAHQPYDVTPNSFILLKCERKENCFAEKRKAEAKAQPTTAQFISLSSCWCFPIKTS